MKIEINIKIGNRTIKEILLNMYHYQISIIKEIVSSILGYGATNTDIFTQRLVKDG